MLGWTLVAGVIGTPSATADPVGVTIGHAPRVLEAGSPATVAAGAEGFAVCALELPGTPAPADRTRASVAGGREVRWRWTVPDDARSRHVVVSLACWRDADRAAGPADVRQSIPLTIRGVPGGQLGLVDPRGVSVSTRELVEPGTKWTERGQFWIALGGLIVAGVGLGGVAQQLYTTRQEGRAARAAALMERHQDREFLKGRTAALRYVKIDSAEECWDRLVVWRDAASSETPLVKQKAASKEPVPAMNDCRHVAEFFEEVAALLNAGAIDAVLAERFFPDVVIGTFNQYWWLVHDFRGGRVGSVEESEGTFAVKAPASCHPHEISVYGEWEALARNMLSANPAQYPSVNEKRTRLWIICLPGDGADRDAYRAVTKSLSGDLADLDTLEQKLGTQSHQPDPVPANVLCIPASQAEPAVHRRCQRLAGTIRDMIEKDPTLATLKAKL